MMRPVTIGILSVALFAAVGCNESKPTTTTTAAPAKAPPAVASQPATAAKPAAGSEPAAAVSAGGDVDDGKKLFMMACANCHGPDGTGQMMRQMMPQIGNLTLPETHAKYDEAAFSKLITEGRNKMPAFGSVFKPEQIKQIIAFARTLEKK